MHRWITTARQFSADYSSINSDTQIQVILDSLNGKVAGTLTATSSGGPGIFKIKSCALDDVSGVRDIYLVFNTHTKDDLKLNWFSFQKTPGEISDVETVDKVLTLKIYPNPAYSYLNIKYGLTKESDIRIEFYTTSGTLVRSINMGARGTGLHQDKIEMSAYNLRQGLYIVRLLAGNISKSAMIEILNNK